MKISKNIIGLAVPILFFIPSFCLAVLMLFKLPWYISLPVIGLSIAAIYFLKNKLAVSIKRVFIENTSIILTGFSAFVIIAFVLYLLIHIFMLGKSNLSWNFIISNPAEGLTQGGIFPAIIGTTLLVLIMSIIGVPIGTITAIYLAEYAKESSIFTKSIRFAANTLAGVPAIVFGLFGLGFFIGIVGKQMDNFEQNSRMNKL